MAETVLVIGGTGPTGIPIVRGLVERGHDVTILHRGTHERAETPSVVRHIHVDPYDAAALSAALEGRRFDVILATYGRLRRVAEITAGMTERFISVGGVPSMRGWMNPFLFEPYGLPVPVDETAALSTDPAEDEKGFRVAATEAAVFASQPRAAHFRYPYVYGPYQLAPREWSIVRRILDGRRRMIIPDDGLTLHHFGYTENLAHAVLLAVDQPDAAAGQIFNAADEEVLTIRQVVELCAAALGAELELVSMPFDLAVPAHPLVCQPLGTHRVMDIAKLKSRLGYSDAVPARQAVADTARWLAANPLAPGGTEEQVLTDPFDYPAEDRLIDAWAAALAAMPVIDYAVKPGWGLAYSGPGGRPRSQPTFTH